MGKTQRKIYEDSRYYKVVARKTVSKIDFSYPMQVQDLILIHATDRGNNEGLRE